MSRPVLSQLSQSTLLCTRTRTSNNNLNPPRPNIKMFSKAFIATLALVSAVSALPSPNGGSGTTTAPPQCCQNVENSSQLDPATSTLLAGLLGVVISGLNVPIGTDCTPVAVLGGASCNQSVVCCGQDLEADLISVNCVPVTANL